MIRRLVLGTAICDLGTAAMNLHVNRNLALETLPEFDVGPQRPPLAADPRAALAAQFIPAGSRVLELGRATLHALLPNGCSYQSRAVDGDFPTQAAAQSDIIVMLGGLDRIIDLESFFTHLRFCKHDVILSYCATDLTKGRDRAALGFANHLSFYDLALLFDRYGFRIECTAPIDDMQMLMRLTPTERLTPVKSCSVAVVSCNDDGNFGDRLGYHMINALLPGEAEVHHLTFRTLHEARETYDLVVLGTGNSMFQPLLGDDVLDIVGRAKAAIGIFGTQYRELIPRPALDRLIDRLDTWFARTEDDVLMYGRGRNNVVHLGDWLIDQFPMNNGERGRAVADQRRNRGRARARPRHPDHPAPQTGLFGAAAPAVVRAHLGRAGGLCRAALGADARHRLRQIPQHADRYFRPHLSGKEVFHGRSRRGHPLQGARAPQRGQGRRADRRHIA